MSGEGDKDRGCRQVERGALFLLFQSLHDRVHAEFDRFIAPEDSHIDHVVFVDCNFDSFSDEHRRDRQVVARMVVEPFTAGPAAR